MLHTFDWTDKNDAKILCILPIACYASDLCWMLNVEFLYGISLWCPIMMWPFCNEWDFWIIFHREKQRKKRNIEFSSHRIDWMLQVSSCNNKMRNVSMACFSYCCPFSHLNDYTVIGMNYGIQWASSCVRMYIVYV